jgi:hypothetical protein
MQITGAALTPSRSAGAPQQTTPVGDGKLKSAARLHNINADKPAVIDAATEEKALKRARLGKLDMFIKVVNLLEHVGSCMIGTFAEPSVFE